MRSLSRPAVIGMILVCTIAGVGPIGAGRDGPPELRLRVGFFDPLRALPVDPPGLALPGETAEGYFLIQFDRPIDAMLIERLRLTDAEPLAYIPDRGYLIRIPRGRKGAVRGLPEVRWLGAVRPAWKLSPEIGRRPFRNPGRRIDGRLQATIDLFPGEEPRRVAGLIGNTGAELLYVSAVADSGRIGVRASRGQLQQVATIPAVAWIEEAGEITWRNNSATWVVQSDVSGVRSIWDQGLHGEDQILGIIDGPIDIDSCFFRDPIDNTPGPGHRKLVAYRSSSGPGTDFHGTHVAGTLAGDRSPFPEGLDQAGHAYAARLSFTNIADRTGSGMFPSNLYDLLATAHADGARVHSNSWGDDTTGKYTTWSVDVDRFSYDFEDDLVVFAVSNGNAVKSPENAKNCLAVAASDNGLGADNFCFGGTGPTSDGRRKPEIYAPGCAVDSARAGEDCDVISMSGTSMAAPAIAAAGGLVRQYFTEGWYPSGGAQVADALAPSGALTKAVLLNATVDMTGLSGYPGDREGWGRLRLDDALYFAGDLRRLALLADVRNADGMSTGGSDGFLVDVTGSAEPLKLNLVFTEPAAALMAADATINDLDLTVRSPSGVTYLGNQFDTVLGESIPGGTSDPLNNAETVLISSPEVGEWLVTVAGTAVNQDLQGYALVASGLVTPVPGGTVRYTSHLLDDTGALANGNGTAEPGETVSVAVSLINLQPTEAVSLSARVLSDDFEHAAVIQDLAQYPDVPAGAVRESLSPHYSVTIAPDTPCNTVVPLRVRSMYGTREDESTFQLLVGPAPLSRSSLDTPLAIAPVTFEPLVSTIQVDTPIQIGDVQVTVNIAHEDIGELTVELSSPLGTTITLHDRTLSGTADLRTTFDSERLPDAGSMDDFNGEIAQGTWSLSVTDLQLAGAPSGTLEDWSLQFDPAGGTMCDPLVCSGDTLPGAVGPPLDVAVLNGTDLSLSWPAVPGAAGYRVWRSVDRHFSTVERVGSSTTTNFVEADGKISPGSWYYRVRAFNSCEWEGP